MFSLKNKYKSKNVLLKYVNKMDNTTMRFAHAV